MNIAPVAGTVANNQHIIDEIDGLISGIDSSTGTPVKPPVVTSTVVPPKTDDEMKDFVLKHSSELVESSVKSVLELQKLAVATGDAELISSLAGLIAASTGAIETVNKLHIQNKKIYANIELKKLEIEGKKEIQKIKNEGFLNLPSMNTNILVATREEIIEKLTGKARAKAVEVTGSTEFSSLSTGSIELQPLEPLQIEGPTTSLPVLELPPLVLQPLNASTSASS